jgi:hypothetical protein
LATNNTFILRLKLWYGSGIQIGLCWGLREALPFKWLGSTHRLNSPQTLKLNILVYRGVLGTLIFLFLLSLDQLAERVDQCDLEFLNVYLWLCYLDGVQNGVFEF